MEFNREHDLMSAKFGSYGEINNGWTAEEAKGFIKINGNQNKISSTSKFGIMIQAGIIGGAGYTAGELIRLLLVHSKTEINFVYSTSSAGKKLSAIHQDLVGSTEQLLQIQSIQMWMFYFSV